MNAQTITDYIKNNSLYQIGEHAAKDVDRTTEWLKKSPNGRVFILEQLGLQLMNPNVETTKKVAPVRIYNPTNLIPQIAGVGLGLHLQRHGIIGDETYSDVVRKFNDVETHYKTNRLVKLYSELVPTSIDLISKKPVFTMSSDGVLKCSTSSKNNQGYGNARISTVWNIGGPHSVLGVGETNIFTATRYPVIDSGIGLNLETDKHPRRSWDLPKDYYEPSYTYIQSVNELQTNGITHGKLVFFTNDSLKRGRWKGPGIAINGYNSSEINGVDTRIKSEEYITLFNKLNDNTNSENFTPPTWVSGQKQDSNNMVRQPSTESADVKFGLRQTGHGTSNNQDKIMSKNQLLDNASDAQPDAVKVMFKRSGEGYLQFRGYISGLSDKWSPSYSDVTYIGRPDTFKIYNSVTRDMSFNLMIVAETKESLAGLYYRLNKLASYTMPKYNAAGIMEGPLMFLTIGNYCVNLPGLITGVDIGLDDNYPWDINEGKPMYINVTIGYDVIGPHIPDADRFQYK